MPIPIWSPFRALLAPGRVVASYRPTADEADPAPLALAAAAAGCTLALSRLDGPAMRFLTFAPGDPLEPGPHGIAQPLAAAPPAVPDLVLAPLVGFDRRGRRLGQGGGHYDRAFALLPGAVRVGVAWSVQEVAALAPAPWDVPLHAVATEREWIACP